MATAVDHDECLIEVPIRLPLGEVERLTRIVERARRFSGAEPLTQPTPATTEALGAFARFLLHARRKRDIALAGIEFGEPSWDMILDLYVQHVAGQTVTVSSLCAASAVPQSTALRWIDAMASAGHFIRSRDPNDQRRIHVRLAPSLLVAIEAILTDMRQLALVALQ
jgi:DNA-binding MarR family transcriptional regulator